MGYQKAPWKKKNWLKRRARKEIKRNNQIQIMNEITQIRKLSLWIFIIPLSAISFYVSLFHKIKF